MPNPKPPSLAGWRSFLDASTAALGALLLLCSVICFFAWNWDELPRLAKFALLEGGLAGATLASFALGKGRPRQLALAFAAGLIGPLLAVYAQSYQTGADPWELFAGWAVLAVPFALAARFKPLALATMVLLNVAVFLFWEQVVGSGRATEWSMVTLAAVNAAFWLALEVASTRVEWLSGRALARTLALASVLCALPLVCLAFPRDLWGYHSGPAEVAAAVLLSVVVLAMLLAFRRHGDGFLLSAACFAVMTVATFAAGRGLLELLENFEAGLPLLAAFVVGEAALATTWLRRSGPQMERA